MKKNKIYQLFFLLLFWNINPTSAQEKGSILKYKNKTLIVFFDGLRPDYITREQMPNLFAFRQDASFGSQHHSVFPTVTRVNSASYATGSYPGTHGILGNTVYFPEVNKNKAIGTGYGDLNKASEVIAGPLLTAVSLGEILEKAGERMMVFSSGTTGQAFLQNYKVNGAIINPGLILPESLKSDVIREVGPLPEDSEHDDNARHEWVTDALLKYGITKDGPLVSAIWLSDPDGAAHDHGMGSDEAVASIKFVDGQFGRILKALESSGLADQFNIIISTDHGFVTHAGKINLTDFLIKEGFKKNKDSDDVVVAEGSVYVKDHDKNIIQNIVSALHKQEWVGAIFAKPGKTADTEGWVKGTLSFDIIHFNHRRSGDILVAPNWDDRKNMKGYAGTDFSVGVAGHGGSSPYEVNIALFAKGPDFKKSFKTDLPTSNVDIVPTILGLYQLPLPSAMDGRAISEILIKKDKRKPAQTEKKVVETEVKYRWGTYKLMLELSVLGKYSYVDFTKVSRIMAP
ncbi:alkaline phosphatase family protein [Dyadobacter psychrotolerans]|uniref:Alkaline phosphatase family protein n=1 Tax=Dyadobacter psychrotolerans TaxID=2541721 RepID=A0A4V2Z3U4_9BACT|nr:alkaline phosphatase family protein [Dyadobacter psychrotolerans]TDE13668.1 alkaline phosphatase family protein [Dyadobacter psychrotolerans]